MEEYDFAGSLRPVSDDNITKKRNSMARNTGLPIELDVTFHNAFMRELALMKIKFPFLTESQVMGRTLDKFKIPNFMGKPYKKNRAGAIITCTIRNAIQSAKKSMSERKFSSGRPKNVTKRRHTIARSYFPIDISINKFYGRRNSRASRNLYHDFTLFSDGMDADDYSIQDSSADDSGLEDFHPKSPTFESNFMIKPSDVIKPAKTYEKRKHPTSNNNGMSMKENFKGNLQKSGMKVLSKNLKSPNIPAKKASNNISTKERNVVEITKTSETPQNIITSDNEGDTVDNSVKMVDETPSADDWQTLPDSSPRENIIATCISEAPATKDKSPLISSYVQLKGKKVSISRPTLRKTSSLSSSCQRIKQSISHVSLEYLENTSTDCSSSTVDGKSLNPGDFCGVKCLFTPKPHFPQMKVNLSVCSQGNGQELPNNMEQATSLHSAPSRKKYRKCSECVPYVDETSRNTSSDSKADSEESPMSEVDEEENEPYCSPVICRWRKSSCSSMDSYAPVGQDRYASYIIQSHSNQGTASEYSDDGNSEVVSQCLSTNEDFGILRGNFSPQIADIPHLPGRDSCVSPSTMTSQLSDQLSQGMVQISSQPGAENPENNAIEDGYFLANLFEEYTNEPVRRTLRSSRGPCSSTQEDDVTLVVE